jgi:hypothetical protein
VDRDTVHIFALEPESFTEYAHVEPVPSGLVARSRCACRGRSRGRRAGLAIVSRAASVGPAGACSRTLARSSQSAAAICAADLAESIGTLGNHVPQLAYAGFAGAPAMLPQSIGPLRPPLAASSSLERRPRCRAR